MMPSILDLTTRDGSTARGALSPVKPAKCKIVLLVHTDLPAGLPTTKGNTKRAEKPGKRALHMPLPESTMSAPLSFWSIPAMMPSISGPTTEGNTSRGALEPAKPARRTRHCRCRRRARPRGREEVRGVRLLLLFFLFLLFPAEDDEEAAGAIPIHCLHAERSAADNGRSAWTLLLRSSIFSSCSAASISSFSFFAFSFSSSSSNFLLALSAAAVRKRSVEESTCSPNAPASTCKPRVGRQSPGKCRWLRSLLCGPGSARMPGRALGGGVFCAREPECDACSTSSLTLVEVFSPASRRTRCPPWGTSGGTPLPGPQRSAAARVATTAQSLLPSSLSSSRALPAGHHCKGYTKRKGNTWSNMAWRQREVCVLRLLEMCRCGWREHMRTLAGSRPQCESSHHLSLGYHACGIRVIRVSFGFTLVVDDTYCCVSCVHRSSFGFALVWNDAWSGGCRLLHDALLWSRAPHAGL